MSADILIHTDANAHAKPATVNVRQRNYFEVHSNKQLSVDEHLRIQRAFIALVELACSRRITSVLIEVSHLHDLALLPDKKTRYHNWRKVLTHEFGSKKYLEQKDAGHRDVFTFSDIRDEGVIKWFHLLEDYPSAMYPMINLFENEDYLTPEIQILLCGVVIENLEFSLSKKKATFQKYVDWLLDDLRGVVILHSQERANWAKGVADAYNGIKHGDHVQMSEQKRESCYTKLSLF